jgi:hypothetical protein
MVVSAPLRQDRAMKRARLIIGVSNEDQTAYQCSVCGCAFPLCENLAPKEMMTRLLATFKDHVRTSHSDDVTDTEHCHENGDET